MDVCPYAFLSIQFIYLHILVNENEYYAYFEMHICAYLCILFANVCIAKFAMFVYFAYFGLLCTYVAYF